MKRSAFTRLFDQSDKNQEVSERDVPTKSPRKNPELEDTDLVDAEPSEIEDDGLVDVDTENIQEPADPKKIKKVLAEVSSKTETLIDKVMEINTDKTYSKLVKLLQSAGRLADELLESEDLLD